MTMGPASRNATADPRGMPFWMNFLTTGTMAHSQTGNRIPIKAARKMALPGLLGKIDTSRSRERKTSTSPPRSVPMSIKGMASRTMAEKIIENVVKASVLP